MYLSLHYLLWPALVLGSVVVEDPSDVISPENWATDNDLIADYNVPVPSSQPTDCKQPFDRPFCRPFYGS